uniref:Methyltransferase domain-containing protein n=1 Tax=viral metagenome TaxID=1070528 RepID=A0A6C0D3N5_9ZZZZ
MIKYITSILDAKGNDTVILKYLVFLTIIVLIYLLYRYTKPANMGEGFTQEQPFVLKTNGQIYDEFYAEVYDEIHCTKKRLQWTVEQILKMTEPTTKNSVLLDVGSGTGKLVNKLSQMGFSTYGVDNSKEMIERAEKMYPDINITFGDVKDPMLFERSTFTHIICTQFTIYQIQDKRAFFRNFYYWLKPNAYLILHLVDSKKFSAISPLKDDEIQWMPLYKTESPRQTDCIAEFDDFQYKQSYKTNDSNTITYTETFIDKQSNHIRQNEQTLFMENVDELLALANKEGFILHGKVDMSECNGDKYQYLYILERMM